MENELETMLRNVIRRFNEKTKGDKSLQEETKGIERRVQILVTDGKKYHLELKGSRLSDLTEGEIAAPDATIISDTATLVGVLKKEIAPFKALATRKIVLKASLADKIRLGRLLTGK